MSFQSAYSSNTSLINDQRSYELNDNIQRSSSTNPDQDKQNFISNLDQFSQGFKKLCEYAEYIDTERDTRDFRNRLNEHISRMHTLSNRLQDIVQAIKSGPSKSTPEERRAQKEAVKKLEETFMKCNGLFKQKLETIEKQLSIIHPRSSLNTNLYDDEDDEDDENVSLLKSQKQEFIRVENESEYQRKLILEREKAIKEINSQVLEVHELFKDISSMVHEYSEVIDTIEDNIAVTLENTNDAYKETETAAKYQKKSRSKLCLIAIILTAIAALVVIIVVVVTQTRKRG